jgi:hypothetical protein
VGMGQRCYAYCFWKFYAINDSICAAGIRGVVILAQAGIQHECLINRMTSPTQKACWFPAFAGTTN